MVFRYGKLISVEFIISKIIFHKTCLFHLKFRSMFCHLYALQLVLKKNLEVEHFTTGSEMCDLWTSFDVICCTSSILHLVAIALDRYWSITSVRYSRSRNTSRIITMILLIWGISICIRYDLLEKTGERDIPIFTFQFAHHFLGR